MEPIEDELDDIIGVLNLGKPVYKAKPKNPHSQKQPPNAHQSIPEEIQLPPTSELDSLDEFQQLYQAKIDQEQKRKREKLDRQLKKTLGTKDEKPIPENNSNNNKQVTSVVASQSLPKPVMIRYLQFKNWSGDAIPPESNANSGYKFKFNGGAITLIKSLLQQNGFVESTDTDVSIIWNNGVPKPETFQGLSAYQKLNHFPKSFEITRKDLMYANLSKMQARHGIKHFDFIPKTYILPAEASSLIEDTEKRKKQQQWYIVKPHNSSQGKGIWLTDSVEEILKKQKDCIVVSHYISNPLLINNLKFDMRIYVGITSFNPLRIYMYEEGLARFATYEYNANLSSKENPYVHLTNYSLNKFSDQFVANEDSNNDYVGHKWSLTALKQYLATHGFDLELIWGRIEDLVIKSILSIEGAVFSAMEMQVPFRDNCFEVLGFDVLVDDALRPWLLEINLSPSLNTDSPMDLKIKGNMIADMFTMMGMVPLDQRYAADKSYLLNGSKQAYHKDFHKNLPQLAQAVLRETDQERSRARGWKCIYPTETAVRYKQFFEEDRPLNQVLRDRQNMKVRQNNPNYNHALKNLKQNPQIQQGVQHHGPGSQHPGGVGLRKR